MRAAISSSDVPVPAGAEASSGHPVRPAPAGLIALTILFATAGIALTNLFLFSRPDSFIWEVQRASGGWINANLVTFLPLTIVVGLLLASGKQRPADLGFGRKWLAELALFAGGGWLAVQLLAAVAAIVAGDGLRLHPDWQQFGAGPILGFFLAMLFGTALFEDTVFRGFLLPQVYLRLGKAIGSHAARAVATLLVCSIIFALWHLPTLLLNRDLTASGLVGALGFMMMGGIMLGVLFMRTGRISPVLACHALVNAPTLVVAAPVSGSALAGMAGVVAIIAGPALYRRTWAPSLIRPTPAAAGDGKVSKLAPWA